MTEELIALYEGRVSLDGVARIWLPPDDAPGATRLFRRAFTLEARPAGAWITLFADQRYQLWVNGQYLGRGPTFYHPHRRPRDRYELTDLLGAGENVVAVLVHAVGIALHNYVPSGAPGLVARVDLLGADGARQTLETDASWRATAQTGWSEDVPRRGWALGFIERYDARETPRGWQAPGFDDRGWEPAQAHPAFPPGQEGGYLDPGVPALRFTEQPATDLLGVYGSPAAPPPLAAMRDGTEGNPSLRAFAQALMDAPKAPPSVFRLTGALDPLTGGFTLDGLTAEEAAVVYLDLGAQHTGAVTFTCVSESEGAIDVAWTEVYEDGRPKLVRKGESYADRVLAAPGVTHWFPHGFSSGRYLHLALYGFRGRVRFTRLGMLASEPDLDWSGQFTSSDERLNAVWQLCARTVRVGTQEGLMDCPTREQAAYVGDGNPTARWIGRLTGDYAHWRHLLRETFAVQSDGGQLKSVVFSGMRHILIDYSLLAVLGLRDYLRETGDLALAREALPACARLLAWYDQRMDGGLFAMPWEAMWRDGPFVEPPATAWDSFREHGWNLFIDHPGLGWHNVGEPGIDRRGTNAAINALLAQAWAALAELRLACGEAATAEHAKSVALAVRIRQTFRADGVFRDGLFKGRLLEQVSQQTNAWCLAAGCVPTEEAPALLRRLLAPDDAALARGGPYFWSYLLPLLAEQGLVEEALEAIRGLWGRMLDGGATTAWETFAGDDLDSWCHPWSAAPADFLPRHVAGIGSLPRGQSVIDLRPRPDLLAWASARVGTPRGPVTLGWKCDGRACRLFGSLPDDITGRLALPDGATRDVRGNWAVHADLPR